jgi:hypothetical protein
MLDHFTSASLEQRDNLLYILIILLAGNGTDTAALALAYMEIEARAELPVKDCIRGYLKIAGPERIGTVNELHQIPGMYNTAVWAEIS